MTRTFSLADLVEIVAGSCPDRLALVAGEAWLSYRELDERYNRLGHHLLSAGVGPDDHVTVWARNRAEWVEATLGGVKARAVPVNVNFRYVAPEIRYLLADAGAVALIVERSFRPILAQVRVELPALRHVVVLDDGRGIHHVDHALVPGIDYVDYETELAGAEAGRGFAPRSGDDRYVLYTGGTTGMPKGVVWRGDDLFFAALNGSDPGGELITDPEAVAARAQAQPTCGWASRR